MTVRIPPNDDPSVHIQYIEFQEGDGDNVLLTLALFKDGNLDIIDEDGKSRYVARTALETRKGMVVVKCDARSE